MKKIRGDNQRQLFLSFFFRFRFLIPFHGFYLILLKSSWARFYIRIMARREFIAPRLADLQNIPYWAVITQSAILSPNDEDTIQWPVIEIPVYFSTRFFLFFFFFLLMLARMSISGSVRPAVRSSVHPTVSVNRYRPAKGDWSCFIVLFPLTSLYPAHEWSTRLHVLVILNYPSIRTRRFGGPEGSFFLFRPSVHIDSIVICHSDI